jgi:16S rRNA (cytosine1402-N4)-methyltransferase
MLREVTGLLRPSPSCRYLDGTLGGGGHAEQILELSSPDGRLLGLDRDDDALEIAKARLARFGDRLIARRASYSEARAAMREVGWERVNGILLDLGLSSFQLESPGRGFSFRRDEALDMRMDRRQSLTAHRVVNAFAAADLERIFRDYGEEPRARAIAAAIVRERERGPIETTGQLARLVAGVVRRRGKLHPATRVFQALRIFVNRELEHLDEFLSTGYELLFPQGRLVILSYHSLEDRLVKRAFRDWSRSCICPPGTAHCRCGWTRKARIVTPKPLVPTREEVRANPRARSAKLRAAERI